ncbi:hypothetical protein RB623_29480 [Mesorhizobium sp. LHD-90]|uniref:hypothetical protein n=1 Tax=Mesorhizobium sp. LHD-90 TaxID=3071414 RepID=UPI0027E18086|nr:hypothetical protein [Mesorhizobium sp. LHD-90]MDQ6438200.1 hypothetical protein [Mesorhizobium sp. LHD-90]
MACRVSGHVNQQQGWAIADGDEADAAHGLFGTGVGDEAGVNGTIEKARRSAKALLECAFPALMLCRIVCEDIRRGKLTDFPRRAGW